MHVGNSLRINAPAIFQRADFIDWLNTTDRLFTWHTKGAKPGEYSDVIVLVDSNKEGTDPEMPSDIWDAICEAVYAKFGGNSNEHVTVRLTNLSAE